LITSLVTSFGKAYEGYFVCQWVDLDLAQQLPVETYLGDKGYNDGGNHYYLELHGTRFACPLKDKKIS
jgi:hypothetical protein